MPIIDAGDVRQAWERRKAAQRDRDAGSLLDGVARSLPALVASYRLTQKAAGVGFDWPDVAGVFGKLDEELGELHRAIATAERAQIEAEVGDCLFSLANVARQLGVDPEAALARSNLKFRRRFGFVERALASTERPVGKASLAGDGRSLGPAPRRKTMLTAQERRQEGLDPPRDMAMTVGGRVDAVTLVQRRIAADSLEQEGHERHRFLA